MRATFTNRLGGISQGVYSSLNLGDHVGDEASAVLANRQFIEKLNGPTQFMNQVHGSRIVIIESVTDEQPTADALVTGIPGITLAVMVADCIPLLLTSPEAVAAVHVGRRGLVNEIAIKTLELMREMGARDISATIGPAICGTCYEVSQELHDEVVAQFPLAAAQSVSGTPALDLPKALIGSLQSAGVKSITDSKLCTVESEELFSYRRDGVTGRQAGLVTL
ncbi:yfiH Multicopper polyphenol oxidase (laccase) [Candidatus Nanopelagicaceae bacterium]